MKTPTTPTPTQAALTRFLLPGLLAFATAMLVGALMFTAPTADTQTPGKAANARPAAEQAASTNQPGKDTTDAATATKPVNQAPERASLITQDNNGDKETPTPAPKTILALRDWACGVAGCSDEDREKHLKHFQRRGEEDRIERMYAAVDVTHPGKKLLTLVQQKGWAEEYLRMEYDHARMFGGVEQ